MLPSWEETSSFWLHAVFDFECFAACSYLYESPRQESPDDCKPQLSVELRPGDKMLKLIKSWQFGIGNVSCLLKKLCWRGGITHRQTCRILQTIVANAGSQNTFPAFCTLDCLRRFDGDMQLKGFVASESFFFVGRTPCEPSPGRAVTAGHCRLGHLQGHRPWASPQRREAALSLQNFELQDAARVHAVARCHGLPRFSWPGGDVVGRSANEVRLTSHVRCSQELVPECWETKWDRFSPHHMKQQESGCVIDEVTHRSPNMPRELSGPQKGEVWPLKPGSWEVDGEKSHTSVPYPLSTAGTGPGSRNHVRRRGLLDMDSSCFDWKVEPVELARSSGLAFPCQRAGSFFSARVLPSLSWRPWRLGAHGCGSAESAARSLVPGSVRASKKKTSRRT